MTTPPPGLRERKKQATREALREAALRLAVEHGPDGVRVEEIAEAAGVSPRTYNNYYASREQAIVAAVTADREERIAAAVAARPEGVRLADAVSEAVIDQYTNAGESELETLLLITTSAPLREAFLDAATEIGPPLADAIAERLGGGELGEAEARTAVVLAASVAAAVRVALAEWLRPGGTTGATGRAVAAGLVVPTGSLPDLLRAALAPLAPAFDAAEKRGSDAV